MSCLSYRASYFANTNQNTTELTVIMSARLVYVTTNFGLRDTGLVLILGFHRGSLDPAPNICTFASG